MEINRVELENIRSYEKAQIEFPSGSVLLSGDIGSGKSSVLLAIEFALFGLQKGALSGNSLLRNGADSGKVRVNFNIDGKDIVIERNLKRGKKSVSQESGYVIADNEKREISTREIKNYVLNLLNYPQEYQTKNPDLYRYTVYTPQEEMKQILLENSDTRLNTLRRIFAMDKYKRIQENVSIFLDNLKENIRNREGMISDLDSKKENASGKLREKELIDKSLKETEPLLKSARELLEEKRRLMSELENKSKESGILNKELAVLNNTLSYKGNQISSLKKNISEMESEIKNYGFDLFKIKESSLDISKKISDKNLIIKRLNSEILEISKKISSIETRKHSCESLKNEIVTLNNCPTCRQTVTDEHKHQITEKTNHDVKLLNEEFEKNVNIKEELLKRMSQNESELKTLSEQEKQLSKAESISSNLESRKKEMSELANDLIIHSKNQSELARQLDSFEGISEKYDLARKEVNSCLENYMEIDKKKVQIQANLDSIDRNIKEIETEIKRKEEIKLSIGRYKKIKDWLNEQFIPLIAHIEKNVMLKLHHEFNSFFKKWFSALSEGLTARLDENFTPIIEQAGYDTDYAYLSGGERTAAALSYRLSLNQVINSMLSHIKTRDLLILDEPTDGFSAEQLDKMKNVLQEINAKQIILVSHESKIENFVDNIIRFEKEGHASKVI